MVRHDGSEDNTLGPDDCKAHSPWHPSQNTDAKLLIYRLFQEGRVLAQDGIRSLPCTTVVLALARIRNEILIFLKIQVLAE